MATPKMRIARVQLPDGRVARFEVEEGTSPQQVLTYAENYFGKGLTKIPEYGPDTPAESMAKAGAEMGFGKSVVGGFGTRVMDAASRLKQLFGNELTPQEQSDIVYGRAASGPAAIGRASADVGAALPFLPKTALQAGLTAAAQSGITDPTLPGESTGQNMLDRAIGSLAGYAGLKGVQHAFRPITPSPNVRALAREGIIPTIGESARATGSRAGHVVGRIEDTLTSFPGIGQVIQSSRHRAGVQELGKAALRRATPRGVTPTDRIGWEGLDDTYRLISQQYDNALDRIGVIRADQQFAPDLMRRVNQALQESGMSRQDSATAREMIRGLIANRESPMVGAYTANVAKRVDEDLGTRIRDFVNTSHTNSSSRGMASALRAAQRAWRDLINRNAPDDATREMLTDANRAFANYVRVERAAMKPGSIQGEFHPLQLSQAVREMAPRTRRGREPLMQDLSDPARDVLRAVLGESGTVPRALTAGLLLSGTAGGAALGNEQFGGPAALTGALAATAAAPLLFSRGASRYAIGEMFPSIQHSLADLAAISAPVGSAIGRAMYDK